MCPSRVSPHDAKEAAGRQTLAVSGQPPKLPDWWEIELPRAPSVNRFMARLGNKSPNVVKWQRECDGVLMAIKPLPRLRGPFEIIISYDEARFGRFDCDNAVKATLDYLQRVEIIENDKWCRQLVVRWTHGLRQNHCRLAIRQWVA